MLLQQLVLSDLTALEFLAVLAADSLLAIGKKKPDAPLDQVGGRSGLPILFFFQAYSSLPWFGISTCDMALLSYFHSF